jgi:DNA-binding FrmR family transcriptional regulator
MAANTEPAAKGPHTAATSATSAVQPARSAGGGETTPEMMPPDNRAAALQRPARAAGPTQGVSRMIDDGRPYDDVLQQIVSVQQGLDEIGNIVLDNYLERCMSTAVDGGDPLIYDELMRVFSRYS